MKFGWSTVENLNAIDGTMKYFVGSGIAAPLTVLAMTADFSVRSGLLSDF